MEQNTPHKLNMRKLDEVRVNKVTGKKERVLLQDVKILEGNGKSVYYHVGWNEYFNKDGGEPLTGEALTKFLVDVRWPFSKVEKGVDAFPPTPENIDFKRKEAVQELMASGVTLSADPAAVANIYQKCAPTHIEPIGKFKQLAGQLENAGLTLVNQLLRGE